MKIYYQTDVIFVLFVTINIEYTFVKYIKL